MRLIKLLVPWLPVLGEAFLAIDRSVLAGLKRYFTFFFTIGTNGLVHFPWASEASSAPKSAVSHNKFSIRVKFSAP